MPGVFLSHSSKDKHFVQRLAVDLVVEGVPVWLDSWSMEVGDPLYRRIFSGIENSGFLIAVISKYALESGWVEKELLAALSMEDRIGRTFILPVRTEPVELPLAIANRIYADFTTEYLSGLERLVATLRKFGIQSADIPNEKRIVPLQFTDTVFLKKNEFAAALRFLPDDYSPTPEQIVLAPCEIYESLRTALRRRIENVRRDSFYSPELEEHLTNDYRSVILLERALVDGILELLSSGRKVLKRDLWLGACRSFAMYVRTKICACLWACQHPNEFVIEKCSPNWFAACDDSAIRKLHHLENVGKVFVGSPVLDEKGFAYDLEDAASVYINADTSEFSQLRYHGYPQILKVNEKVSPFTIADFIIPQLLFKKHVRKDNVTVWNIEEMFYGQS
jgi:hypothetical protein